MRRRAHGLSVRYFNPPAFSRWLLSLLSLLLGAPASPLYHSSYWLWFTAFVGLNLFQSGFTRFCPAEMILWKLGIGRAGDRADRPVH